MNTVDNAMVIEAQAADWIVARSNRENWTEAQQVELDAWLADNAAHQVAYLRLLALWNSADRLAVLARPMRAPSSHISAKRRLPFARIAAALGVVAVVAGASFTFTREPADRLYSTPIGGREIIALRDGSRIELNTNTVLRIGLSPNERTVTLVRGEAFFNVKHDSSRPFIVEVGGHRITDIGTKFLVRSDLGRVEVSLFEGRARFDFSDEKTNAAATVLSPGDVAVATASALSLTRKPRTVLEEQAAWRQGVLVFDHTTLADAATEVNRYSSKKLVVVDPRAAGLTIGGTFPTGNARMIAEAAQDFYGLKFEDRGDEIVISR